MTETMTFNFTPENGRVPRNISEAVRDAVFKVEPGQRLKLTVGKAKKYSSDPQRRYYWAVIIPRIQGLFLSNGGQYIDEQDLHSWLMWNVGGWTRERKGVRGEKILVRRSYTDLSTLEAEEHHTKCRLWAAERGLDIPEPNEEEQA